MPAATAMRMGGQELSPPGSASVLRRKGGDPSRPVPVLGGSHSVARVHKPHNAQCDAAARGGIGSQLRQDERREGHRQTGGGEHRPIGHGVGAIRLLQSK